MNLPPNPLPDSPINRLGPYLIDRVVGQGAMGLVFSAAHETTGERAAIKVLNPNIASNQRFRERFEAEIESLKTLNHPNIVKLFGYGEYEDHLYYAMELVEGTNLQQEIGAGRRFNWRDVTQIGIDIARALKHAHDHGVIHRDLKPANLLVDENDQIKLTDFGIAKLFGTSDMTLSGNVMGTVDYMAPEQASGDATSPRCDLYSLGCVMYVLLAGTPPFRGNSIPEVLHKVRYEQHRPVSKLATDVPKDLEQVIDELLEKDPEDRIRTALSLSHRLRAIQQALSISTTEEEAFSSDEETRSEENNSATNLIVNPPPDIAERPTVFLTEKLEKPAKDERSSQKRKSKPSDHFTRIEQGKKAEIGRVNEFSSAVPLLLLLLTVLGGLMGGIWYSSQPLSPDDLYARIIDAADDTSSPSLAKNVDRFLEKYPDDTRIDAVKGIKEEVDISKLQRLFEIRARGRPETGSLSPIEVHCNEAFRMHREGNVAGAIEKLKGIQLLFGSDIRSDIRIQRSMELVSRLLPQWEEELEKKVLGLRADLEARLDHADEVLATTPEISREIWTGVQTLHREDAWAADLFKRATTNLGKLLEQPTDPIEKEDKTNGK